MVQQPFDRTSNTSSLVNNLEPAEAVFNKLSICVPGATVAVTTSTGTVVLNKGTKTL